MQPEAATVARPETRLGGTPIDEMVDGGGRIRASFRPVVETLYALGHDAVHARARLLDRAATEEGAASLLPGAQAVAWRCDPVPLPMGQAELDALAEGLAARADLIERMLVDLYGPQRLVERGLVPARTVFSSRRFLRASRIEGARRRRMLDFYAADLVRAPDGVWRVAADRTGRPGGLAGLLENRRLLRRVMPELFGREVRGLDRFVELWRERLRRAAPGSDGPDAPGIALLTEGHLDPAWFEHVLLARALGCELVQGGDLTLRGGRLFLKTLRGLKPIDVLLNRQNPRVLDPLELDWDDHAGVPGLMAVMRAGRVAICNDPGCGLAETPGFLASLPAVSAALDGGPLALGQVETLWLGDPSARARILAAPEGWRVRTAGDPEVGSVRIDRLSPRARARLLAELDHNPGDYVAAALVSPSTLPTVAAGASEAGHLEPHPFALRLYLLHDGERWVPLQGGFVRLLGEDEDPASRLPRTGRTKDVLVLPHERDGEPGTRRQASPPLARPAPLAVRRVGADLPARVANDFFWLGRELERLEMRARLTRTLALRMSDFRHRPRELVELRILAACLRPTRLVEDEKLIDPSAPGLVDALSRLAVAGGPLADHLLRVGRRIDLLHDRLTSEMHLVLSHLLNYALDGFETAGGGSLDRVVHVTGPLLAFAAALNGLAAESMVQGGGRLFLELGLRLTRAEIICLELGAAFGPANELRSGGAGLGPDLETALALALELRDSSITYRGRYFDRLELAPVLDLVLADRANPRSLASQYAAVLGALERLGDIGGAGLAARAGTLLGEAERVAGDAVGQACDSAALGALAARFRTLSLETGALRREIARRYIDLLPEMQAISA